MHRLRNIGGVLLGLLVVLLLWGLAEPYFIDEQNVQVSLPGLPADWEGQRVAAIADLQVGMVMGNTLTIRRVVDRLVELDPAAVLIAGDFIYHAAGRQDELITRVAGLLAPLGEAGIPTYAVLGNHDYDMPTAQARKNGELADALTAALEGVGIKVLQNRAEPLALGGDPLYIVGLDSHIASEAAPQAALADLPRDAPRLVFMHHPNSYEALPPDSAPFALSAHTHGGQFRVPFTPSWTWMSYAREDSVHADGFIEGYGAAGNQLYINRGIGFSVVPIRLNCPPEVTLVTLVSGG